MDENEGVWDTADVPSTQNTQREILDRELESQMRQGLDRLPEQQRTVFAMRYLEGMTLKEIAEMLEISEGGVKAHLWQAGKKMKQWLGEYLQIGGGSHGTGKL